MNTIIESLNWRYAVKKYDPAKKLSADDISLLKETVRLSPSSFGLQPYRVLFIEDYDIREKLKIVSFNQPQITDAACLVVFAVDTQFNEDNINRYFDHVSRTRGTPIEGKLEQYKQSVVKTIAGKPATDRVEWAARQAFLGLGFLLFTAAQLGIDANPMEGFTGLAYDELLGLKEKGLRSVVIAGLGYRHPGDPYQKLKKVRKPTEELFINL